MIGGGGGGGLGEAMNGSIATNVGTLLRNDVKKKIPVLLVLKRAIYINYYNLCKLYS